MQKTFVPLNLNFNFRINWQSLLNPAALKRYRKILNGFTELYSRNKISH